MLEKIKKWYRGIPDKKKWIDLITALLTIPVLITVILNNIGNLKKSTNNPPSSETPQPTIERIIITGEGSGQGPAITGTVSTPSITPETRNVPSCNSEIPPFDIAFPNEGDNLSIDPVCISLRQTVMDNYCPVVWAYRINGAAWSTFSNDPICLYNMASGPVKLEVDIKSTVSGEENIITRNFIYQNKSITPSITPSPSSSPLLTPSDS